MKENTKYKVIKNLVDNNGNKYDATLKLPLSICQINRTIKGYKFF